MTAGPTAALDFTKPQPGCVVFGRVPLREQLLSELEGRRKRRLQEEVRRYKALEQGHISPAHLFHQLSQLHRCQDIWSAFGAIRCRNLKLSDVH